MDEGAKKLLFQKGNEGICKYFLEGKGMPWEEKYCNPVQMFEDTFVFLTMNTLPKYLQEKRGRNFTDDDETERKAHRKRCNFFHVTDIHSSEFEEFPYESPELAAYL